MLNSTMYTFYIPIHDPKPFDPDDDILSQIMRYIRDHDYDKKDVIILQTSQSKVNMPLGAWVMSREYELTLRREYRH